jgi:hypothetical protein
MAAGLGSSLSSHSLSSREQPPRNDDLGSSTEAVARPSFAADRAGEDAMTIMCRRTLLTALAFAAGVSALPAAAHNNPSFKEVHLLTLEVAKAPVEGDAYSKPFALELPKKTIELIWRVAGSDADGIRFSVAKDGVVVADDLASGDTSNILKGNGYRIVAVEGADGPFELQVFANVIDRSSPAGA